MQSAFAATRSVFRGCRSKRQAMRWAFGLSLCALRPVRSALRLFLSSFLSRRSAFVAARSEGPAQRYEGRAIRCPNLAMQSPNLAMRRAYLEVLSLFVTMQWEGVAPNHQQSRGHRAFRPMLSSSRKAQRRLVGMQSEREAMRPAWLGAQSRKLAMPCLDLGMQRLDLGVQWLDLGMLCA
jgi:hypothetical protein